MGLTLDISEQKLTEERIRKEAKRTETLVKIASQLNSTLNIQKVLDMVCNETAQALNVPIVSILLLNKVTNNLEHAKSIGISEELMQHIPLISRTIIDELTINKSPVVTFSNVQNIIKQNGIIRLFQIYARLHLQTCCIMMN